MWIRLVRVRRPGGRALSAAPARERRAPSAGPAVDLAPNTAWNRLFLGRRSPRAGVAGTWLLDAGNAELIRRTARTDGAAAPGLVPYALRCGFATALNTSIARRNR
ncbi:TspO/MBR family protein [Streptomyces minutiscleroticus]|uniref:TspO/MBR family protein n=1 Tax=Streptomyces minutiscleroticus TaxID=68238 RepID=UPI0033311D41